MVERFDAEYDEDIGIIYRQSPKGSHVRYRDYAALEAQLDEAREAVALFENYGCPVCHGDCASANPPVYSCPMEAARRVREGVK